MSAREVFQQAKACATGTAQMTVPLSGLRRIRVPIPPAQEQRRIVAAIDEQLSRLEAGVCLLESVGRKLARMRRSVFRAALQGELTASDQTLWEKHRLADVVAIASGQTPRGLELADTGPIPFYKVGDMNMSDGEYMRNSRGYIDSAGAARFGLHIRPAGTVVFPKRGGAIATNKKRILSRPSAYDLNTMGLIPGEEVDSRYLYMWLGSIDLASLADGSNVPQINHGDLADQVLNLPPIDEQVRIAATADVYFDHIAALGGTVEHSFVRVGHLRSQVLTAAVSGTLTPHDPAEEPASALLERFAHESRNDKRTVRSEKSKRARKGVAA